MKTVLVTGSNGQLGSEIRKIAGAGASKYIFTDVGELNITDADAVRKFVTDNGINVIVNCAAYTNVEKAESDEATASLINNTAAGYLATAAAENGAVLIHISTDYVFGGNETNVPLSETDTVNPLGVYGKTKLAGEEAVKAAGCRYIILRTAWLYSAFGKNFVKTMRELTASKEMIKVVFDQVGTPTYAGDLAALICKIIEDDLLDRTGIYHFSNEGAVSWYDFAKEICELSGNICDIQPCHSDEFPSAVKRPSYSVLDKTLVKETFGIRIPYWKDSLKKCIYELIG